MPTSQKTHSISIINMSVNYITGNNCHSLWGTNRHKRISRDQNVEIWNVL